MSDLPASSSPPLPQLVQRYLNGESIQALAAESSTSHRTIYHWLLKECGAEYDDIVTQALVARIADADLALESASTPLQVARAREAARFARMDYERRRPRLYGPKQELQVDTTVRVILHKPAPLHIDEAGKTIEANSQVLDSTRDETRPNV